METLELIMTIIIFVLAIAITVLVLLQSGKQKNLSGAIAGGYETFLGKDRAKKADKLFDKATVICSVIFAVLVLLVFIIQPSSAAGTPGSGTSTGGTTSSSVTTSKEDSEAADDESVADESDADEESGDSEGSGNADESTDVTDTSDSAE